jgi:ATP/maltotriose-dependent transcriptional regulator MalT
MATSLRHRPPVATRSSLLRPRLLALLAERFSRRLVVITAPAGFGKSTLLTQALSENALSPQGTDRWVTCSPEDGVLTVLYDSLAARCRLDRPPTAADRSFQEMRRKEGK